MHVESGVRLKHSLPGVAYIVKLNKDNKQINKHYLVRQKMPENQCASLPITIMPLQGIYIEYSCYKN